MAPSNWQALATEAFNFLKTRYSSANIKSDFNYFLAKAKAPKEITVGDAKTVGTAAIYGVMGWTIGEAVGQSSYIGYVVGYDVNVQDAINAKDN
ncbi:hypothetical protein CYY_004247 [Polysphondylium violaceum]|uniref:Uncharacterized protein n=1 Tax=Polysphondylium violaceum TaxID=133409 RepID=A0A8J4V7X7_9MYCE|nr:hypothetical protein CYY_004247 [Polysphondylium violaceum]